MWTYFSISAFSWGQARSKLGGVDTSILHHVFMLIFIASLAVISLHGTILMPFLSYFARFTWRGRIPATGILAWKWSKVEIPILRNSKRRKNQRGIFFPIYQKYWAEEVPEGREGLATSMHGATTPRAAPWGLVGIPLAHLLPSFAIWRVSSRKKIKEELFRGFSAATRRNLSRTNLELQQTILPGKLPSRRGKSSPSSSPTLLSSEGTRHHQHLHQHHLISKP